MGILNIISWTLGLGTKAEREERKHYKKLNKTLKEEEEKLKELKKEQERKVFFENRKKEEKEKNKNIINESESDLKIRIHSLKNKLHIPVNESTLENNIKYIVEDDLTNKIEMLEKEKRILELEKQIRELKNSNNRERQR